MHSPLSADRCLFTGSNGRLGRLLQRAWPALRDAPPALWLGRSAPADLLWSTEQPLPTLPPCGTLVALWGRTSGDARELALNSTLLDATLTLARHCGARRILHFSSAAVYGPGIDLRESDTPNPESAYGRAKWAMERAIAALPPEGFRHTVLRLANVVGADSLAPALLPQDAPVILDRFAAGHGPLRSYIAPGDLARVLAALALLPPETLPACLNVTAPHPIDMQDLAQAAGRPVRWRPAPEGAIAQVTLNAGVISSLMPTLDWRATAADMIADWRELEPRAACD